MPRIDPLALLNCLSVLLGPNGGIKGTKEVDRLATLMTKFSKKLVSKCIYIQILKTTNTELLNQFMSTGGWDLIHIWLTDAIVAKNTALIQELLELLLLCPVDIARLKSNNNPKLIKGLSKEGSLQSVRTLACRLVDQWLKIVKDSVPSEPQQPITMAPNNLAVDVKVEPENPIKIEENLPPTTTPPSTVSVQDLVPTISPLELPSHQQFHDKIHLQPVQLQIVNKTLPGQSQPTQIKKQSFVVVSSTTTPPSVPVYKITIRDGKQVLTKVETDAANITKNLFNDDKDQIKLKEEIKNEVDDDVDSRPESGDNDQITPANEHSAVDAKEAGKNGTEVKSSDKENRDSPKKEDKTKDDKKSHHKSSSKSSSSSRHSSSKSSSSSSRSSSHKSSSSSRSGSSSSKSSSRDKDRHHSSSRHSSSSKSRSEREKEKEKERLKKDQAEKDKATLEKVQGQAINAKIGKIPKKKPDDEKSGDTSSIRKSSTDSRDSSKENKTDAKKTTATGGVVPAPVIIEKKNISISIENRKNSQESSRPKTVKTFNSKFRSTGLEEEVKPPPSRAASKKQTTQLTPGSEAKKIIVPPPKISLKRASPLRETGSIADKRAKLSLDPPVINAGDDKKGAIKLIAPKPKPMVLQESDMFMDALTASTKNEKPRKRKRRNSLSKDGTESKRMDTSVDSSKESSPTPQSPPGPDERSPISFKPEFKFYQDTLEINEDKEQSTNDKSPEIESPEPKDRTENAEDDEGSRTPTGEEEIDELKPPASPDNDDDAGKTPASPNSEIRYVDGLRSVLLMQKRKGPKKSLKWKEDLESIRYFELDETERVNVTKTFTDMKQMEKQGEREAFQMARKLSTEDLMEERTRWRALIPIDMPPPLVEPGKDSKEREIQYAREKGILQALYFNRSMIPDSPSEPDEERHHAMTDPKIIPLDDLTGNRESEKDFTSVPWPEPKPQLTPTPPVASVYTTAFAHNPVVGIAPAPQMVMNPPMTPMIPVNHVEVTGGGGWRTGDGEVVVPDVNMASINNLGFPPPNMMPPPGMFNHAQPPDAGFPGMPPGMDDGNFPMPNNFQGPNMFGPGPNFQGPPPPRGGGGGGGGGMHGNRGRGGPGWFRGGPGPIRGAGWANRGAWRGGKQPPVCRQFTKNGFCRVGDKCQYLHPGVNCPPF